MYTRITKVEELVISNIGNNWGNPHCCIWICNRSGPLLRCKEDHT